MWESRRKYVKLKTNLWRLGFKRVKNHCFSEFSYECLHRDRHSDKTRAPFTGQFTRVQRHGKLLNRLTEL